MAGYNVLNGELLELDETTTGVIDFLNVVDGTCEITNTSDDGVVLEFASGGHLSVGAFGKLDIQGKMVSIGSTDGSRGSSVTHWQSEHPVNVIWIETSSGSGEYEEWIAINPPLSGAVGFSNFADDAHTGKVFEWNNGTINFSTEVGEASVPVSGADIVVPNIIMSTENPFNSIHLVEFRAKEEGEVSFVNTGFSDFGGVFDGISSLATSRCSFFGPMTISGCDLLNMEDTHVAPRGDSSVGLGISYCDNGVLNNVTGVSIYSRGIDFSYSKNPSVSKLKGITYRPNSLSDSVFFNSIRDGEFNEVSALGGPFTADNCTGCKVVSVLLIDELDLQETDDYSSYNMMARGCSKTSFITVSIPEGGGAYNTNIEMYDNSYLDIVNTDIQSAFANDILIGKRNFNTRISQMFFTGSDGDSPIGFDETNDSLLLHGVTSLSSINFDVRAKDTIFKGVLASFISTGDTPLNFSQIYSSGTDGKLLFTMSKDSSGTIFSDVSPGIRWGSDSKAYFGDIGDSFDVVTPYNLKGVSLTDTMPTVVGGNTSGLSVEYSINHGSGYLPFKDYTAENIVLEVTDPSVGFMLKIRIMATDVSVSTYVNSVELQTTDDRFSYPLDYETGRLQFDSNAVMDFNSRYFIYYADGYGTADGVLVRDANGTPITGHVPPGGVVDFTYDFIGDTSNGRIAGMPFGMVVVLGGSSIVADQVTTETFESGATNIFPIRTQKEYAYVEGSSIEPKVSFDGASKTIIVADGVTKLDFQKHVFSAWKDWFITDTNSRFKMALTTSGGEDSVVTANGEKGITYFIHNDWKIRPFEGSHRLSIFGNVYTSDDTDPFIETLGNYKVTVTLTVSNIISSSAGDISAVELEGIGGDEWTVTLA